MEELVAQHELEPLAVLQQFTLIRRGEEDAGEIKGQGRGEAIGEIRRIEQHEVRALARLPIEKRGDAGIDAFGGSRGDVRLRALLLGEVDQEMLGLERAPAKRRVDEMQFGPLRVKRHTP